MGQTAHPGRRALVAVGSLVAAVSLTGCGQSVASATTTLSGLLPDRQVTVVHSNGQQVPGVNGLRLHHGDVVRTGPGAQATLVTRSRHVYEGPNAAVQILDGATQSLRQGAVVVDAVQGPGLRLAVAALSVDTPAGSATRSERAVMLRIGSLVGSAEVASDTGQQLRLPALNQIVVGGDALPDAPSPLRLTDDYGEAHAAPALVRDDKALVGLAAGVDAAGATTVKVVTAGWHGPLEHPPAGLARSEQLLPVVIAAAAHPHDAQQRYGDALELRKAGGSWGVVAHRLDTTSDDVLAAFDRLDHEIATGHVGTIPAALRFLSGDGSGSGDSGDGSDGDGSGDGGGPQPSASPSPSPSDTSLGGTVGDTINRVLKLLPTSTPTPVASVPLPLPSVSGLPLGAPALSPSPTPAPH
jgi:hypothetical protein